MFRTSVRSMVAVLGVALVASMPGVAAAQANQQKLVDEAAATLQNFMKDPEMRLAATKPAEGEKAC